MLRALYVCKANFECMRFLKGSQARSSKMGVMCECCKWEDESCVEAELVSLRIVLKKFK